ncbi:hypothetical protein SAMN04487896_2688 [Paenibacillus sp. ov031]|uniref:hypothetical protein n=1 Tax=Paenibacillus sp. ov031 TaxID=1761879 RepID=UPI00091E5F53|nr:hypothetical protein [Paenibacillus sp. ov031]SHN69908.1 hypothetical protein SAMN04487896_2688 [Paenibacillus sp. ov031]
MMTTTPLILVVVAIFSYVFVYFFSKVINPQGSKKYVTLASISFTILVVILFSMFLVFFSELAQINK